MQRGYAVVEEAQRAVRTALMMSAVLRWRVIVRRAGIVVSCGIALRMPGVLRR